jgi:hypothetical protein
MIAEKGQKQWGILAKHAAEVKKRYPTDATVLVYIARTYNEQGEKAKAKKPIKKSWLERQGTWRRLD